MGCKPLNPYAKVRPSFEIEVPEEEMAEFDKEARELNPDNPAIVGGKVNPPERG